MVAILRYCQNSGANNVLAGRIIPRPSFLQRLKKTADKAVIPANTGKLASLGYVIIISNNTKHL